MSGESPAAPRRASVRRQFVVRHLTIAADTEVAVEAADWRDAIVVVERGPLEVECVDGIRSTFMTGAVLCLDGLRMRALSNRGPVPVQLFALSRARQPAGEKHGGRFR
jgi:hypothetical protein